MDGILNINKPSGMTSHDVVVQLRRLLGEKKVGHTGTLDPDATGVLPICIGKATKIIQFLENGKKGYEGTITLGIVTDTLDAGGQVLKISDTANIEVDDIKRVFNSFVGEIYQTPPMVSAIKVHGKRLYNIARQGKIVERTPRKIHIYNLELINFYKEKETKIDFRVACSKGTYVRALAADIGDALGCGAHLSRLVRTKSGMFKLEDSIRLEEVQADPKNAFLAIRSVDDALSFMPGIVINDSARKKFLNGVSVDGSEVLEYEIGDESCRAYYGGSSEDLVRICDKTKSLLGIGKAVPMNTKKYKAVRVLN